jgi:hypothetical protein
MGTGMGEMGRGGGVGSEGWRSKVRVDPAAKVAPLPKPDRPPRSRRLNVGECFCIREILFRRLLRQKCELSVEPAQLSRSPPSLLNALALRRSDRS